MKATPKNLSHERLVQALSYEPETGLFRYRFTKGRAREGEVAGSIHSKGYRIIRVDGNVCRANRLAWFYVNGVWPNGEVDHINRVRSDDRIENLRDVPPSINRMNRVKARTGSFSGLIGACTYKGGKFRAVISANGKQKALGIFDTAQEAHAAYLSAKAELHSGAYRE